MRRGNEVREMSYTKVRMGWTGVTSWTGNGRDGYKIGGVIGGRGLG